MAFDKRAYWERVLRQTEKPAATKFLGFELIDFNLDDGWIEAAFELPPEAANPAGDGQGGFITAMLDEVMSYAGSIVQEGPALSPTLQMTTSFIRPVPVGERLVGRGEVVRAGRRAIFTQGWLYNAEEMLLAQATASCIPRAIPG